MTHFVSTAAALSICECCDMPTLTALDEGIPARVELIPLPALAAEIAAIAHGRLTYTRLRNGQLAVRDQYRLADPDSASQVHAQHVCPKRGLW